MERSEASPNPPEYGPAPQYPIESVDNALRVLLLVGEQPNLRLTDVSRHLGVASSTAHRLLAMLQYRGFVRQDGETRGFLPGPTLDGLALGVLRRLDVRSLARPVLERLKAELGETIHLGRLESGDVHFLDSIESDRALRVGGRLGLSVPAHCTSSGKAMLATLPDEELYRHYTSERLPRLTPNSITTRTDLLKELAEVRRRGHATSDEESEEGVASISVALQAGRASPLAITASAPVSRMSAETRRHILAGLEKAAEEISALLF